MYEVSYGTSQSHYRNYRRPEIYHLRRDHASPDAPNYGKIRVANSFEAGYGGSEANIALALANLGVDSTFFSVVPNNSLGKSAIRMLRSNDVHCTPVVLSTPEETPTHRLGTYYLETGYGVRPSKVTYDRKNSAITEYDFSKIDADSIRNLMNMNYDIKR